MMSNVSWMKILFLGVPVFLGGSLGLYLATDFDGPTSLPSSCCNQSEFKGVPRVFPSSIMMSRILRNALALQWMARAVSISLGLPRPVI